MTLHVSVTCTRQAIAWCRICRPGCVVGQQQAFVSVRSGVLCVDHMLILAVSVTLDP